MKSPLYALLIAPNQEVRQGILNGTINTTICEEFRDYHRGPVMLCCHTESWVIMANIVDIQYMALWQVTQKEIRASGYRNPASLLRQLRLLYPDISRNSSVTVIKWDNLSGALVEEIERKKALSGKKGKVTCDNCTKQAIWIRKTAFSGNHFFCEVCAKAEKDFGQEDSSYFYWTELG